MKIDFIDIRIGEGFFNPTLVIAVGIQFEEGRQVLINASGDLIYKEKIIGRLELWKESFYNINAPVFTINALNRMDKTKGEEKDLHLEFQVELGNKVIKYINDERKSYKNGDVLLEVIVKLLYIQNTTYMVDPKKDLHLINIQEMNLLSTLGGNSQLELRNISQNITTSIKASDWINDFAPKLGLGEYEIIEIPRLNAVNIKEKFSNSLSALEVSRKYLYSLNNGSAMSSLRNSLREFNEALKNLGYRDENGKNVDYGKIFDRNKNNEILVETLQKNLYSSSSRGEEPAAAHMGNSVEGYEIESMIFMTYSLYKMVFEKIREKEESEGE